MRARLDTVARTWAIASFVGWVLLLALALGSAVAASEANAATADGATDLPAPSLEHRRDAPQTTVDAVSSTVMCPTCDTTLDQSNSPAAERMRTWIAVAVQQGWTAEEIRTGLVKEYGGDESILATPRAHGIGLAAWLVPAVLAALALVIGTVVVRRWRRDGATDQTRSASSSSSTSQAASSSSSPS
jgi:cytochrome c-type biogenesis protein CcmH/NrfF